MKCMKQKSIPLLRNCLYEFMRRTSSLVEEQHFLPLKGMGFNYHQREDKTFFYEGRDIAEQRHFYLRKIREYWKEQRPIMYLDETWANSNIAPEKLWVDEQGQGGWKRPSGKGQRLIILHAGMEQGVGNEC